MKTSLITTISGAVLALSLTATLGSAAGTPPPPAATAKASDKDSPQVTPDVSGKQAAAQAAPAAPTATPPTQSLSATPEKNPAAPLTTPAQPKDAPAAKPDPEAALDAQLKDALSQRDALRTKLDTIVNAPLSDEPAAEAVAAPPAPKEPPKPTEIPKEPLPAAVESYADSLFALGRYAEARAAYAKVLESKPTGETLAWTQMQIAHCARHMGDLPAAIAAYEQVITQNATSPWVKDAEWWAGEVGWRMKWNQTVKGNTAPAAATPEKM